MAHEELIDKGLLVHKIRETRGRLALLRDSLVSELGKFDPLEELAADKIMALAVDFSALQIEYQALLATEKALHKALGK